ncbi:MAG TPA: PSD1 and planctomycete cytochrome C domain-containing protein [Bryobacteraceae bacterium]|nr:PSD1 and planctomycete cytochrome C domain-containing protein [Bryobacteraceae bacterium]
MPRAIALVASAALLASHAARARPQAEQSRISYTRDIRPIFEASCWKCHGGAVQLSKLDLRTRDSALAGGVHGPAIAPGKPDASKLFRMVAGLDKPAMPLDGKLTPAQIQAIRAWIEQGAVWEAGATAGVAPAKSPSVALEDWTLPQEARSYWAFRKPARTPVPITANARMNRHPVDAFLMKTMAERGLKPAPEADRRTLVRRAFLDLIGIPPSPSEVAEFVDDRSPDAWERLIERLLASPHYGERWGRHWLDVARYADSNGYEHDFDRPNAWRYRDYVIQSFNKDTPYNVFLREQIAGDELDWVTHDSLIATGFLRSYAKVGFREKDNPEFRYEYLDDMIATIGRGVLGLTVQCARCHNHKFDPIGQSDYYRLQASLFGYVEVDHPLTSPEEAEAYEKKQAAVNARVDELRAEIRTIENPYRDVLLVEKYKKFPQNVQQAIATPEAQRTPGQVLLANQVIRTVSVASGEIDRIMKPDELAAKKRLLARIVEAEKERPAPIPVAMGVTDGDYRFAPDGPGDEPAPGKGIKKEAIEGSFLHRGPGQYIAPPSYFLVRGDVNARGSIMRPGFPAVISTAGTPAAIPPAHGRTSGRRRALAEWLVSPDNPLTARVLVNRIWHHHFGRGIVATLDNFGKMGEPPTHPELLDWLALEFMDRGWSIRQMHRLLMRSEAYKMSSQFAEAQNTERDPENRYLWRFRARRLDAEIVRDSILAVSGGLNREIGGPAVFPKLEPEVLSSMRNGIWRKEEDGPKVWRRSVYIYRKRGLPFPLLETFDLPDQNVSCGARSNSTVPTQALMLLNDEFVVRQSEVFGSRVRESVPNDAERQVDLAYAIALGRPPNENERKLALEFIARHDLTGLAHVLMNLNEFVYLR